MNILKKLLISSFVLFSFEISASLKSDYESKDITISSFKESLTTLDSESIYEKDFLERFELAINNVIQDELDPAIPQEAQKFRASYQAVRDLYEAYNVILKDEMAKFIGSLQTEDESLIIKLVTYNELWTSAQYYNIDYFIKGFIDLWPNKLLTEDKLEIFCYVADDKIDILNLFVNRKLVSEEFIKKILSSFSQYRKCAQIVLNSIDNEIIPISHISEYLKLLDFKEKADLIDSCIAHTWKFGKFTKTQFDLCVPAILTFRNTKPGINSWPNPYQDLSTRNAIFAFAIRSSVISEENLPEYLEQLPKMEQLQLIKDLCEISLIKKRDSVTSWLEKLPCTEFRQFIEAYIEEHI